MEVVLQRTTEELQKYRKEYKDLTNKLNEINEIVITSLTHSLTLFLSFFDYLI